MATSRKGSLDLNAVLETIKTECGAIRKDIKEDLREVKEQISKLDIKFEARMYDAEQRIKDLQQNVLGLNKHSDTVSQEIKIIQDKCTLLEIRSMESMIRLRGIREEPMINLKQLVIYIFSKIFGIRYGGIVKKY